MNYRKTYKKRKAFHITIIAISVIAGLYFNMMLPGVIRDNVPCVDVIFPERTEYIPSVTCSGTVGYSQVRSIKEEIPLIIKEYLVNVGDRVDQGQTIAVVDKQAVCDKLSNIYSGSVSDVLTAAELSDAKRKEVRRAAALRRSLAAEACSALRRAKELHDELEAVYHPFVDFRAMTRFEQKHLENIFSA